VLCCLIIKENIALPNKLMANRVSYSLMQNVSLLVRCVVIYLEGTSGEQFQRKVEQDQFQRKVEQDQFQKTDENLDWCLQIVLQ
jgi:hypothetical protein